MPIETNFQYQRNLLIKICWIVKNNAILKLSKVNKASVVVRHLRATNEKTCW